MTKLRELDRLFKWKAVIGLTYKAHLHFELEFASTRLGSGGMSSGMEL